MRGSECAAAKLGTERIFLLKQTGTSWIKSARKFQLWSVLSLQGQVNWLWSAFELVGDRHLFTCSEMNQYVNVECKQLVFMIKTGNDTFLS